MIRNAVSVTAVIDAPPEKVFSVLCDVERWPEWTSTMTRIRRLEKGPFAVGSSARVRQPRLLPAVWQVTELENQRNFTWTARSPGVRMTARHLIEPQGSGSRVVLSFELAGRIAPLIARLYGGLIERYIATEAQGLKKRSESTVKAIGADAVDLGNR
jgi:uncharacterized protein YndB with AHSA1/START domain